MSDSFKKNGALALQLLLGATFVFAGIIKLFPIEPFEFKFAELGFSWAAAAVFSRSLIIFECALGFALIAHVYRKPVYLLSQATLLFFTIYLFYAIYAEGDDGNCGCFGTFLKMTPSESIIKNVAMMILLWLAQRYNSFEITFKPWIAILLSLAIAITTIFYISPMNASLFEKSPSLVQKDLVLEEEIMDGMRFRKADTDIRKDTFILAALSLQCNHCKEAIYKLNVIRNKINLPPVRIIYFGDTSDLAAFEQKTRTNFPYTFAKNDALLKYSNFMLPMFYYMEGGKIKYLIKPQYLSEEYLQPIAKQNK